MELSIIIPSFNGANKIVNLLTALENQSDKVFEVIIVVDGSTDDTITVLKKHSFQFGSLNIIEQSNQGRSKVRNNGAKAASGELLLFFDDDMRPLPDCVQKHRQHHKQYPGSILTGGIGEEEILCKSDIQSYKAFLSNKWSTYFQALEGKPLPKKDICLTAANFSIPKTTFFELGSFDETLRDIEDYDLAVRAFQKGIPIYFNSTAFAWHDDFITCATYITRQQEYQGSLAQLQTHKPDLYNDRGIRKASLHKGLKARLLTLFANKYWINVVDNFNWLKPLPRAIRYAIYDLIITSHSEKNPKRY